jgi:hypothetical protein
MNTFSLPPITDPAILDAAARASCGNDQAECPTGTMQPLLRTFIVAVLATACAVLLSVASPAGTVPLVSAGPIPGASPDSAGAGCRGERAAQPA